MLPVGVGQDLDLDVARAVQEPLDVDAPIAERAQRLPRRPLERAASSPGSRTTRIPFPPPPAAAFSMTGSPPPRPPTPPRRRRPGRGPCRGPPARPRIHHGLAGPRLVAHGIDGAGRRSHEHQARLLHRPGERRPLRQEPVPRDGWRRSPAPAGRLQDPVDPEVALRRRRRPSSAASSAASTWAACRSASEYTATLPMPSSRHARITRRAISPSTFSVRDQDLLEAWLTAGCCRASSTGSRPACSGACRGR
jgi:hypothetical protein